MNCVFNSPTIKAFIQDACHRTVLYKSPKSYRSELKTIPKMFFVTDVESTNLYFGAIDNDGMLKRITQNYSLAYAQNIQEAFHCCLGTIWMFQPNAEEIVDYFWQSAFIPCDWNVINGTVQYERQKIQNKYVYIPTTPQPKWTLEDLIHELTTQRT